MAWTDGVRARLRANLHGRAADAELDEEFRFHVEMETARLERSGVAPAEARRRALVAFGGVAQHGEAVRAGRGLAWLEGLLRDARVAVRGLRRSPALVVGAVLSIGLAIGLNTAVFSFLNALLYKPLPVPGAERMVLLGVDRYGWPSAMSYPTYREYRDRLRSLEGLAIHDNGKVVVQPAGSVPEWAAVTVVSGNFFEVLGLRPERGRFFLPDEDRTPDAHPVAVVSDYFWRHTLARDPGAIGRTLIVNGEPMVIVGVAPAGFDGAAPPEAQDVYVPVTMAGALLGKGGPTDLRRFRGRVIGRMRAGVSTPQVQAEFGALAAAVGRAERPGENPGRAVVVPARGVVPELQKSARRFLFMLMAMVATTLVAACANVAGMLLARAEARSRELAIQSSLGARRSALVRAFLVEGVVVTAPGAALGFALSFFGRDLLANFLVDPLMLRMVVDLSPDLRVVGFVVGVSLACAFAVGVISAFRSTRRELVQSLRGEAPLGRGRRATLAAAVVVVQIAIAVPLLFGATSAVRTVARSLPREPGFRIDGVVEAGASLTGRRYADAAARSDFYAKLLRDLQARPEVASAGLIASSLFGPASAVVQLPGELPARPGLERRVPANAVTSEVLPILGLRLLRGRLLEERDRADAPLVAVVTATLARRLWPGGGAVGAQIDIDGRPYRIVGVVADAHLSGAEPESPYLFLSYAQNPARVSRATLLVLPRAGDPQAILPTIRRAAARIDPEIAVNLGTLRENRDSMLRGVRAIGDLIVTCALLSLLLAAIGTYALLAFRVARRSREIGVRMALGARERAVQGLVLRQGMALVAVGLLLGLPVAPFTVQLALRPIAGDDALASSAVAAAVVFACAALASWLPALRATRVDPASVLRLE